MLVLLESVSRFDSSMQQEKLQQIAEQRAQRTRVVDQKEELAQMQRISIAKLQEKIQRIESTILGLSHQLGVPIEKCEEAASAIDQTDIVGVKAESSVPLQTQAPAPSLLSSGETQIEAPSYRRESGMQRRRREQWKQLHGLDENKEDKVEE